MRIGAVVLAAGIASRMGDFKPMLPLGKESVIQNVVRVLQSAGARQIVVVTGYRSEVLVDHLKNTGVMFAENKRFAQTKMFDSVLLGLRALGDTCDKVLVTPADVPLVRVDTVRTLLGEEGPCVRPLYQGEPGHPILLDRAVVPLLMGCSGKGGLRGAIQELGLPLRDVAVEDENTIFDIDTPDDYVTLLHRAGQRRIRIRHLPAGTLGAGALAALGGGSGAGREHHLILIIGPSQEMDGRKDHSSQDNHQDHRHNNPVPDGFPPSGPPAQFPLPAPSIVIIHRCNPLVLPNFSNLPSLF